MNELRPDWLFAPEIKTLTWALPGLRFVGGAVRDSLLGKPVGDVDAAIPLAPEAVMAALEKAGIRAIPTGIAHGTVTALVNHVPFEITTLRKDVATDGRHAQVAFTDDWEADAARRDFTMNALYLSPEGELFDYFGGAEDAKNGVVKFIGDTDARIQEDYLRILRFFRFFAHYGKGEADILTIAACETYAEKIDSLSGERVQAELFKLLAAPESPYTLRLMEQTGILRHVLGFDTRLEPFEMLMTFDNIPLLLRFAIMLLSADNPAVALVIVAEKLRLSNEYKNQLSLLLQHSSHVKADTPLPQQKHLIRTLGAPVFSALVCLRAAMAGGLTPVYEAMLDVAVEWKVPVFPITGADLKAQGFAEGKALGDKLKELEEKWEASDYALTKEELLSE